MPGPPLTHRWQYGPNYIQQSEDVRTIDAFDVLGGGFLNSAPSMPKMLEQ